MAACGLQAVVYKGYVVLVLKRMMDFLAYGRGAHSVAGIQSHLFIASCIRKTQFFLVYPRKKLTFAQK